MLKEFLDGIASPFDLAHGVAEPAFTEKDRSLGPCVHHENVGPELLETPDQLVTVGMLGDEGEEVEIALCIPNHARKVAYLKKTEVAVIILDALLLQFVALLGRQFVVIPARFRPLGAALMINEQRLAVVRPLSVRPAGHLHLENPEVDPELQFFVAVEADDFPHFDRTGFMGPIFEERIEVKTHYAINVGTDTGFVNPSPLIQFPVFLPCCFNSTVEQEIDSFIRFLATERGLSDNYQLSTRRSLAEFAAWCSAAQQITAPAEVTQPLISDYLSSRKKNGLSASSIKLIVVALKIFFRFLIGKGALKRDPTETLTLPRMERYLPETLNELQVERLIESIDTKQPLGLRDRAILELLYASGLRISELANARLENLNFEERILRVTGKGNKMRLVPVGRKACEAITTYISAERPELVEAPQRERDFSVVPRDEANDCPRLANRESARPALRIGDQYLSAPPPP